MRWETVHKVLRAKQEQRNKAIVHYRKQRRRLYVQRYGYNDAARQAELRGEARAEAE